VTEFSHVSSPLPTAAGPRIWPVAVAFGVLGLLAGAVWEQYSQYTHGSTADALGAVFVVIAPLAAFAFALLVFRVWRRRTPDAWPRMADVLVLGGSGIGLALGGWGMWTLLHQHDEWLPVAIGFGAVFLVGLTLAVGAVPLGVVAAVRAFLGRSDAR
jgi:hypothetical protein